MNSLIKYFVGSRTYTVLAANPSRLAGRIMAAFTDVVYDVHTRADHTLVFSCLTPFSKKVLSLLDCSDIEIVSEEQTGFPMFLRYLFSKKGIVAGLTVALISVVYFNGTVWDMYISGNDSISDEEIESTLRHAGLSQGMRYHPRQLSGICNRFILLDDRFSHISVNMSGNAAFVEVVERRKKTESSDNASDTGLVAAKDCIIERPEVIHGTALFKSGDTVEKGTLIVSPVEIGKNGNEYITGAAGKVYAKTYEQFTVIIPYKRTVAQYREETAKKKKVSFPVASFELSYPPGKSSGGYICRTRTERVTLPYDIVLPVKIKTTDKLYYDTSEAVLTSQEAEQKAYSTMYRKISADISDGEILSTSFASEEQEDAFVLHCTVECIRNVAVIPE